MTHVSDDIEAGRLTLQASLDGEKTQAERNRLGQFATPTKLARDVLTYGLALIPKSKSVRFLDPALGTGSFFSALQDSGRKFDSAQGFEIDPHYGAPAVELWIDTPLQLTLGDFTAADAPIAEHDKATLLICNPPYVRHHHLEGAEKVRLHAKAKKIAHIGLSGLSGLYCYFLALSHAWMAEGGVAGWLIPSEFMDVNYGRKLKEYLLRDVTLLHIHRFDPNDVQFDDALVSSAVVWFRKEKPPADHSVNFSFGGSLAAPMHIRQVAVADLKRADKWTRFPQHGPAAQHHGYRLADLFVIKRGLATGDNGFFIIDEERVKELNLPARFLRPILPSSRHIQADEILADAKGIPLLQKRQFLIDCDIPAADIQREYPSLWAYLETGLDTVAEAYLCKSRKSWYMQEKRAVAPIICTYLGRSDSARRPFRFLLNHSHAIATNVYLMLYPQPVLSALLATHPDVLRELWEALNAIKTETLLGNGRVYGGGLHKLEPRELANVPADDLAALVGMPPQKPNHQLELLEAVTA